MEVLTKTLSRLRKYPTTQRGPKPTLTKDAVKRSLGDQWGKRILQSVTRHMIKHNRKVDDSCAMLDTRHIVYLLHSKLVNEGPRISKNHRN